MCSITRILATPFDLYDGVSIEAPQPICACAVKPRRPSIIYDPQPRLLPATARKPRAQRDNFATDLDESEVADDEHSTEGDHNRASKQWSLHLAAQRMAAQLRPPRVSPSINPGAAGRATPCGNQSGAAVSCNRLSGRMLRRLCLNTRILGERYSPMVGWDER
jgi:hypothetical protein